MSWLVSFFSAVLCGVTGLVLAGFIANACVTWYHISSFEGGSGYFVVFMALLGGVIGFVAGLITSAVVAANGGATGARFGIPLAVVAGLALIVTALAWMGGDVPPTLRGDRILLAVELRAPAGWKPSNRIRAGSNWIELASVGSNGAVRHSVSNAIELKDARFEEDRWVIPGSVRVFTTTGGRAVTITLGNEETARFLVPLPARPGIELESWSAWLPDTSDPTAASGFRYRFRVRRAGDVYREREAADEAWREEKRRRFEALTPESPLEEWVGFLEGGGDSSSWQSRAGEVVKSRPDELVALVASPDPDVAAGAIRGLGWTYPRPDGTESALRVALTHIDSQLRAWQAAHDPADPDLLGASEIKERYVHWMQGWGMLRDDYKAPVPPELLELRGDLEAILETPGLRGETELDALESLVQQSIDDWDNDASADANP